MALKFSEGLLSGFRNYGQGQQPRQQRGSGGGGMLTPAPQPYNPAELLVQNLGRSGIIPGVDMRTPLEALQEQFKTIPQEFPASAQSKLYDAVASSSAVTPKARLDALTLKKALEKEQRERGEEILKQQGLEDIFNIYMSVDPESWQDQALVVTPINNIVKEHNLDPKEAQAVFESAKEIRSVKDPSDAADTRSFGPGERDYVDEDGNFWRVSYLRNEGSVDEPATVETLYTPIGHDEERKGELKPVEAYGETAIERSMRDAALVRERARIETEEAKKTAWNIKRSKITDEGLEAGDALLNLRRLTMLAEQLRTGGWASVQVGLKGFFGLTNKTEGEFIYMAGSMIMTELEKFKGSLSDGERRMVTEFNAGFGQSQEMNLAIFKAAERTARRIFDRSNWLLQQDPETFTERDYKRKLHADIEKGLADMQPSAILQPGGKIE